jgi:hypothetical protein
LQLRNALSEIRYHVSFASITTTPRATIAAAMILAMESAPLRLAPERRAADV